MYGQNIKHACVYTNSILLPGSCEKEQFFMSNTHELFFSNFFWPEHGNCNRWTFYGLPLGGAFAFLFAVCLLLLLLCFCFCVVLHRLHVLRICMHAAFLAFLRCAVLRTLHFCLRMMRCARAFYALSATRQTERDGTGQHDGCILDITLNTAYNLCQNACMPNIVQRLKTYACQQQH